MSASPIFAKNIITILIMIFLIAFSNTQPLNTPIQQYKNVYKLQIGQTLNLSISQPTKINLINNKLQKPHTLTANTPKEAFQVLKENKKIEDHEQGNNGEWNITIIIKNIQGSAQFFFIPKTNILSETNNLKKDHQTEENFQMKNFMRETLLLKEGINVISSKKLRPYFYGSNEANNILQNQYSIICLPKKLTKFLIKEGEPQLTINPIKMQSSVIISSIKSQIESKIYRLMVQNNYAIRFIRKKGFPLIKIFECTSAKKECFYQKYIVPISSTQNDEKQIRFSQISTPQNHVKFMIVSMLTKSEEYVGTKCKDCELYLSIQSKQQQQTEVQITLQPPSSIMQLKENQILKEDLIAGATKKYEINLMQKERVRISVQVYEGETKIQVKEEKGDWAYSPLQTTGVILIDVPVALKAETLLLQITALNQNKDASYSVVYSEGEYQIFIKDGYPTTHVLKPKQNISFFYHNQEIRNSPIYLSFNLNKPKAIGNLDMKIYYYTESQNNKNKEEKVQFQPTKSIQQLEKQANSVVFQIPGNYPKLQIYFSSSWEESVEIAMTINDEEIIFLPLYHSLPLQIDKNGGVNLLVDNNEQGFIELTIKKCDESFPQIAYSLSPQDFMRKIYDYQSVGDSERIIRSTIKVKKGGGLYIHISGDQMSNSFIQISAKYMQKDRKKLGQNLPIKRGDHGQMNYQLITNSKAQIWFKQIECSAQCRQKTKYQCYLSTSRSDMYRQMICPGIFMFKKEEPLQKIKTESYQIQSKPDKDNIIAFKQNLHDSIIFLSVKAKYEQEELIYKDIEIVTFSGQISRMSAQFLFITVGIAIVIIVMLLFAIRRQARMGYTAVSSSQNTRKKKSKLEVIKGH